MTQLRIDEMFGAPRPPRQPQPQPQSRDRNERDARAPRNDHSAKPRNPSPTRPPEKLAKDSPRRASNRALAEENGRLTKRGYDVNGTHVDLPGMVGRCKRQTRSYTVDDTERILAKQRAKGPSTTTVFEVSAESSMAAAQRLASSSSSTSTPTPSSSTSHPTTTSNSPTATATTSASPAASASGRICVLNFASARHVGGGYLTGAKAQEEDVCRVSALYSSLLCAPDFYNAHKARGAENLRYSHRMVYSPDVPVFRDAGGGGSGGAAAGASSPNSADGGVSSTAGGSGGGGGAVNGGSGGSRGGGNPLLARPYLVDILTSPAPNATALRQNLPSAASNLEGILRERAGRILALALEHGADTIVMGAWGCGVFGNDLTTVLSVFKGWLEGELEGRFEKVVWAMNDDKGAARAMGAFPNATRV